MVLINFQENFGSDLEEISQKFERGKYNKAVSIVQKIFKINFVYKRIKSKFQLSFHKIFKYVKRSEMVYN